MAGIPCAVVAPSSDATTYSSAAMLRFHRDRSHSLEQFETPVLSYYSGQPLIFVSRHRERLARGFRFAIPDADLVEAMVDKARFSILTPVPATMVLTPSDTPQTPELAELGYPLIIKPDRRDRAWRHVESTQVKAKLAALGRTLVAQQYLSGAESAIECYHVYADRHGEIVAEFTGKKIRTYPLKCGSTTALRTTDEQHVLDAGRELVALLELCGVAKFDDTRDAAGQQHLLEINTRTSLWNHPGAKAGVNIPAAVYADLTRTSRPVPRRHPSPGYGPRRFSLLQRPRIQGPRRCCSPRAARPKPSGRGATRRRSCLCSRPGRAPATSSRHPQRRAWPATMGSSINIELRPVRAPAATPLPPMSSHR
jgi:hypothetical protein